MMALRAKFFEYKDQNIRRRTQKTFFYGPNNMEPLNIPYIADTTISGGISNSNSAKHYTWT
jgi:hypothetical protein